MEKLNYTIFRTDMGWMGILSTARGLLRTTLPQASAREVQSILGNRLKNAYLSPHLFEGMEKRMNLYFSGHNISFPDKLDLSGATVFQHLVWDTARLIPYGESRSYSWVAQQINQPKAVRAVGQALGRNPLPIIIPCHRVLAIDGRLGGFSGGLEMKRKLLQLESQEKL